MDKFETLEAMLREQGHTEKADTLRSLIDWKKRDEERMTQIRQKIEERKEGRSESVIMPAGRYIMGDPCYCFSHDTESWRNLCNQAHAGEEWENYGSARKLEHIERVKKMGSKEPVEYVHHILWVSTKWGDGGYDDQFGHTYFVDAGLLGLVPVDCVEDGCSYLQWKEKDGENNSCGRVVEFSEPFECYYEDGKVVIGPYVIDTDPAPEDEDFENEDESYDYDGEQE